ncbi:hypothetical protein M2010_000645 [Providencia stuartii]|uniref:hypothetical protein n=1 Tax=Providencia stuartii TaxID=588 RepID=UPI0012B65E30|nr:MULTISPECIES: hypothetical protein [Providencia]MTC12031.1 hypothetical protein [Providencia stuartii]GHB81235.1 hypothetical protein GCM10007290_00860 [Providencia thailandensis]
MLNSPPAKKFKQINHLSIHFKDNPTNIHSVIYANGYNQVEVIVTAEILDENNDAFFENEKEFRDCIYFCSFSDQQLLGDEWIISEHRGDYCKAVQNEITHIKNASIEVIRSTKRISASYYFSLKEINPGHEIAVGVRIDGEGLFNTSQNGTLNHKGEIIFIAPKRVIIQGIKKIDYDNNENIAITDNDWQEISKNISFHISKGAILGNYEHNYGVIRRKTFKITTHNKYKLKYKSPVYSLQHIPKIKDWYHNHVMPHAIKIVGGPYYSGIYVNSWFIEPNNIEIGYSNILNKGLNRIIKDIRQSLYCTEEKDGRFVGDTTYAIWPRLEGNLGPLWSKTTLDKHAITIVCHQMYLRDKKLYYWGYYCPAPYHVADPLQIFIIDEYGNRGNINIVFEEDMYGTVSV